MRIFICEGALSIRLICKGGEVIGRGGEAKGFGFRVLANERGGFVMDTFVFGHLMDSVSQATIQSVYVPVSLLVMSTMATLLHSCPYSVIWHYPVRKAFSARGKEGGIRFSIRKVNIFQCEKPKTDS